MIVNLEQFIRAERPRWEALEKMLDDLARDDWETLPLEQARELERLYQRASADFARLTTFSAEAETKQYLEGLVARAHAEIHGSAGKRARFRPWKWAREEFPRTFRAHLRAFWFAAALMVVGVCFGALALQLDPESKEILMPFEHLQEDPDLRVAREEAGNSEAIVGREATFAGDLMTHNTRVAFLAMSLGLSWGVGTLVLMVGNGIGLGAVAADYIGAGQGEFLFGWILPHGSVEIPAILIGAQAGFVLAGALLDRRSRLRVSERLKAVVPPVFTLSLGAALLLVWAGVVEAFISQHHAPVIPYSLKIAFGVVELVALACYLGWAGRGRKV